MNKLQELSAWVNEIVDNAIKTEKKKKEKRGRGKRKREKR